MTSTSDSAAIDWLRDQPWPLTCNNTSPTLEELYADLIPAQVVVLSIVSVLTFVTVAIFVDECLYLFQQVHNREIRIRLIWMRGLYPVFSITSLICIIMPRATVFCNFVSSVYLGVTMYEFYILVVTYFDGEENMLAALVDMHPGIPVRMPPLACCCFFLKHAKLNKKNMTRIKCGILQMVLIRPVFKFLAAVLWANGNYIEGYIHWSSPFIYLKVLSSLSTVTAMYSLCILSGLVSQPLAKYFISLKKLSIQLVLIVSGFQGFTMSMFTFVGLFHCVADIHPRLLAAEINYSLLVLEVSCLSILVRACRRYARHEGDDSTRLLTTAAGDVTV